MLESTELNNEERMDNSDTYGVYLQNTDMTEYSKAFNSK